MATTEKTQKGNQTQKGQTKATVTTTGKGKNKAQVPAPVPAPEVVKPEKAKPEAVKPEANQETVQALQQLTAFPQLRLAF